MSLANSFLPGGERSECLNGDLSVLDDERIGGKRDPWLRLPGEVRHFARRAHACNLERGPKSGVGVVEKGFEKAGDFGGANVRFVWRDERRVVVVVFKDFVETLGESPEMMLKDLLGHVISLC